MLLPTPRGCAVAIVLIAAVSACGSPSTGNPVAAGQSPLPSARVSGSAPAPAGFHAPGATGPGSSGSPGSPGSATASAPPASGSGPAAPAQPSASDTKPREATAAEIPITASVSPACVPVGGVATLRVHTVEKAYLGYLAMYAGKKSGAKPPYGEGYGGNDKGQADHGGDWVGSWTVAVNAPTGKGYVTLVVGANGNHREIDVPFSVGAREVDGCGTA